MITVRIGGGLGNQLYYYSLGYALAKRTNQKLRFDISNYGKKNHLVKERPFKLNELCISNTDFFETPMKKGVLNKIYRKLRVGLFVPFFQNGSIDPYEFIKKPTRNSYWNNFWVKYTFFDEYRDELSKQFQVKKELGDQAKKYISEIERANSVMVHIRRGDYVSVNHSVLSMTYYKDAMRQIYTDMENPQFYFFSDDLPWVKNRFGEKDNYHYVDKLDDDLEEFSIMSHAANAILADSTFSWWATYINDHNKEGIVICPKGGKDDVYPSGWRPMEAKGVDTRIQKDYE